jgi:sulfur carrier protein ThiS
MQITVKLVGGLVHTVGFSEKEMEVPLGMTAAQLLAALAIDRAPALLLARNGWAIAGAEEIREGDRIVISPAFSGG